MIDLSCHVGDIEQQLYLRSCGAHAGTTAREMLLSMQGKKIELDRLFLYYVLRDMAGYGSKDLGVHTSGIVEALRMVGVPPTTKLRWLDDVLYFIETLTGRWKRKPSSRRFREALKYRIAGYEIVTDIKQALDKGMPVIAALNIREAFKQPDFSDYANASIYDQHVVVVAGYDDNTYLLVNSWGKSWGENGMCRMPIELFEADCYGKWGIR